MNNHDKTYAGLARATQVVAAVCGGVEPGWLARCERLPEFKDSPEPSEEEILDWSSAFGTSLHEVCLEGKKLVPTDSIDFTMAVMAKKAFDEWFDKYKPARMKVEQVVIHPKNLYGGTIDVICRIDGELFIVDLKFYGWWKMKYKYVQSKDIFPSYKQVKVNLQTNLYEETQPKTYRRACLIIGPNGYLFHEFKRKSTKLEEALEVAKNISADSREYHLTDF